MAVKLKRPRKPRKRKAETPEQHKARISEWQIKLDAYHIAKEKAETRAEAEELSQDKTSDKDTSDKLPKIIKSSVKSDSVDLDNIIDDVFSDASDEIRGDIVDGLEALDINKPKDILSVNPNEIQSMLNAVFFDEARRIIDDQNAGRLEPAIESVLQADAKENKYVYDSLFGRRGQRTLAKIIRRIAGNADYFTLVGRLP